MINLLPDQRKIDIRAARANVIILRYVGIVLLALLFLGVALYASYSLLKVTMNSSDQIIASNDVKADIYSETKTEVDALSGKLNEAKTILDQEVRYSKVLLALGQITPAGTVIDQLKLNSASFTGTPVDITVYAKSTAEASAVQSQFQTSALFQQVNLKGTDANGGIDGYPVKVSLTVIFNKAGVQ